LEGQGRLVVSRQANIDHGLILAIGDSFSAGDVLLEVETDKAQMDVEAQDDGVMFKITVR
jgi:pyruvate/2-oxoglutarate dehydrogenase complex dihydrolipoamide acyltransferase (E2) component